MDEGKLYIQVEAPPTLLQTDINNAGSEFGRGWPHVIEALGKCGLTFKSAEFDVAGKGRKAITLPAGVRT